MKTVSVELRDRHHAGLTNGQAEAIHNILLKACAIARGRKTLTFREPIAERVRACKFKPHPDSWRFVMARYLQRKLPTWVGLYVGGHHIAVFLRQPNTAYEPFSFPCLGRICETKLL